MLPSNRGDSADFMQIRPPGGVICMKFTASVDLRGDFRWIPPRNSALGTRHSAELDPLITARTHQRPAQSQLPNPPTDTAGESHMGRALARNRPLNTNLPTKDLATGDLQVVISKPSRSWAD